MIKAVINELDFNIGLVSGMFANKEILTKKDSPTIPYIKFRLQNMEDALSTYLIDDEDTMSKLPKLHLLFQSSNELIQQAQSLETPDKFAASLMKKLLSNFTKEDIRIIKGIKNKLEEHNKKLRLEEGRLSVGDKFRDKR